MNATELRERLSAHGGDAKTPEHAFAAEWWYHLSDRKRAYYVNTHPRQLWAWQFIQNLPDEELMFLWAVFKM